MNAKSILLAWLMLAMTGIARATDVLKVQDVVVKSGESITLEVGLDNTTTNLMGWQCDIELPEGLSLELKANGKPAATLGSRFNDTEHSISSSVRPNGDYRFIATSMDGEAIPGSSGTLFTVTLKADASLQPGTVLVGTVRNIEFNTQDNHKLTFEDVTFNVSITDGKPVITLAEGWNWMSHGQAGPLALDGVKANAQRILSQTQEVVYDDTYGWVGNLQELAPATMYKVQMKAADAIALDGTCFDNTMGIGLKTGWNWLGYTPTKAMALETALSGLQASDGDRIVSQDGFAEYQDGAWNSSFGSMEPGKGYMYQSAKDVEFCYPADNAAARATDKGMRAAEQQPECPWEYDVHRYPDVTTIISLLQPLQTESLPQPLQKEGGNIAVAAFCGEECRGIGRWVGDKLFITVHGTNGLNETITFRVYDPSTGEETDIEESFAFQGQCLGTLNAPMQLHVQSVTGLHDVEQLAGTKRVYSTNGKLLNGTQKGVNIIVLPDGSTRKKVIL